MRQKFLGGSKEVGRSCALLETCDSSILVDCGLKQGAETEYPELGEIDPVDAVILTHAHVDHAGGLPLLINLELLEGDASIFCIPPTAKLLSILLWDSYKLQRKEWEHEGRNHLYEHPDVQEALDKIFTVPYQEFRPTKGIGAEFGYSGHILGSAWVRVEAEGRSFLFTGDLGEGRSFHLKPAYFPPQSDFLITESTYGDTMQHSRVSEDRRRVSGLAGSAEGPTLIPVFATGRSVEILQLLRNYDAVKGERVWYDGMIDEMLPVYRSFASDVYMNTSFMNRVEDPGSPRP